MMRRSLVASVMLTVFTAVLAIHADDTTKNKGQKDTLPVTKGPDGQPKINTKDIGRLEKEVQDKFRVLEGTLRDLANSYAKSPDKALNEKAKFLEKILDESESRGISQTLTQFLKFLGDQDLSNTADARKALEIAKKLADDLKVIRDMLAKDNGASNKREQRLALQDLLKDIDKVIRDEKIIRDQIASNPNKDDVADGQGEVKDKTQKVADKADPKGGEAKDLKGTSKEPGKGQDKGDARPNDNKGEAAKANSKDGGKDGDKKGEAKDAKGDKGDKGDKGAKGEPKDGKGAENAKAGQSKDAKDAKGGNPSDAKGSQKDGQAGEAKDAGKKDGQPGNDKQGNAKPADKQGGDKADKQGNAKDSKQGEASKSGQSKGDKNDQKADSANSKSGDSPKSQDSKPGEAKSGQPSQGQPKSGQPSDDQAGSKSDGGGPKKPQDPKDDLGNLKKKIQDAIENMEKAKQNVEAEKRGEAGKNADDAIKDLGDAKKKLEDLIRQLREEELERILANLIDRCQKMLAMQQAVMDSTIRIHNQIENTPGKKADRDAILESVNLSEDEFKIVQEASKAIEVLEGEGSAVAFPEAFRQLREDMKHVQRRLKNVDCGDFTIGLEEDIISTLKDMIKDLTKAKKDLDDKKNPPKDPKDGPPPPEQDKKLLEKIQELKRIRSMQLQINDRTSKYAKAYPPGTPRHEDVEAELRDLIDRQERLIDVTNKIARGDNQ
jgi:hypothetical protein